MAQQTITLNIGGKSYQLAVESGQEKRLQKVAEQFDDFVSKMQQASPNMDRDRVLVLAGLMMSDAYYSLQQDKDSQEQTFEAFQNSLAQRIEKMVMANQA